MEGSASESQSKLLKKQRLKKIKKPVGVTLLILTSYV